MTGSTRASIGRINGLFAVLAPVLMITQVAFAAASEPFILRAFSDQTLAWALLAGGAVCVGVHALLGPVMLVVNARRPPRSLGRARLMWLALGSTVYGWASAALGYIFANPETISMLESGLGFHAPTGRQGQAEAALLGVTLGGLVLLGGAIAAWQLVPATVRKRCWLGIDAVLIVAVVWAVVELPVKPASPLPGALVQPIIRHSLTTAVLLRLTIRFLPFILSAVETAGFRSLVAARHLRAKKSGFLAAISLLSVLAVTVSCTALTTTLSVMGGFRNDLKRKILGNNAHIVIDREHADIEGYLPLMDRIERVPQVVGAAPYVSGEVMLSSASNLATAVLRGIDPATVGKVNDLPKNLTNGKLEYLDHPERLLDLPRDPLRSPLLPIKDSVLQPSEPDAGTTEGAPPDAGLAAATKTDDSAARAGAMLAETQAKLAELEAYLRASEPVAKREHESREILPGIIIGQELARALRLYVGDEVNVVAPLGALGPSGPMPKARPFRVAGIFYSGMYEYDMKFTYVALPRAQAFLGTGDAITGIEVRVADIDRAPATAQAIRAALARPDLRVRDWQDLNSRLFGALALEKLAMFVALGIAILVASFCIAGTLTLMVQEKGREVAILKAMGTSDRAVVGVFVIEGGLIGLLGAALGLFLGYMACFGAENFGIRMNPEVYYIDRLPVHVDFTEFALTGVAAVVVCLIVTIYPALLASRLRPVDALRYE